MQKIITSVCALALAATAANAQVKKVILEDFTGTWCGWCPEGTIIIDNLLANNPTTFIPVASHNGDVMQIPEGAAVDSVLKVTGYPNGAVDRHKFASQAKIPMSRSAWTNSFNIRKQEQAIVSVSFSDGALDGNRYTGKVNVQFTAAPKAGVPLKMNVYILEDSIPAIESHAQKNFSSSVQGGATPLTNWFHNATLRHAVGGAWGFATTVPATPVVGTTYTENISFEIPAAWVKKHIHVLAFVAYDGNVDNWEKEILNAEQISLPNWTTMSAVNLTRNNLGVSIYPNPARNNSFIKTEFTLEGDATVSLEVVNALGQVVSRPYKSFEIAGSHTIQWNPREYSDNMPTGIYFIRLTTDKGDHSVSRLVIE